MSILASFPLCDFHEEIDGRGLPSEKIQEVINLVSSDRTLQHRAPLLFLLTARTHRFSARLFRGKIYTYYKSTLISKIIVFSLFIFTLTPAILVYINNINYEENAFGLYIFFMPIAIALFSNLIAFRCFRVFTRELRGNLVDL